MTSYVACKDHPEMGSEGDTCRLPDRGQSGDALYIVSEDGGGRAAGTGAWLQPSARPMPRTAMAVTSCPLLDAIKPGLLQRPCLFQLS